MRTPRAILKRTIINSLIPTSNRQTGNREVSQTNGTDTSATAQAIANNAARRIPSVRPSSVSSSRDFQI